MVPPSKPFQSILNPKSNNLQSNSPKSEFGSPRLAPHSLALILILSSSLLAQTSSTNTQQLPRSFSISGRVDSPGGAPARSVIIHVMSQSGMDRQYYSDDMGRYEIRDLPRGRYFITVENRDDPDQYSDPVEADTSRSMSGRLLINIYLRSKVVVTVNEDRKNPTVSVAEAMQRIPKPAQKAFEQAVKLRAEGQSDGALESFGKSIDLYPGYFQALTERGHLKITMGQMAEAATDFSRALDLNDRYEPALRGSGLCKFERGRFLDASQDFERAIALNPANGATHMYLGITLLAQDRRAAARLALKKALSLDSAGTVRAHFHLANLNIKENHYEEALTELQAYLTAVPNPPDVEKLRVLETQLRVQIAKP